VKTDDWSTRRRDPASTEETKVVRLRDWLGPEEELVPIGPRADRDQASQDRSVEEPEAGSGFWEGDPSLQTAIPAPENRGASVTRARARGPVRWRWVAAGVTIAALAAVTVLIVSGGGGRAPSHGQTEEAAVGGPLAPNLTKTVGRAAAATRAAAAVQERKALRAERQRQAAVRRARAQAARARAARARQRHRAAAASGSTASVSEPTQPDTTPAYTETAASTPPPTESEPAQTTPVQTTPTTPAPASGGGGSSNGSNSTSSSSKTPAFGSGGALGPGSSPDS
jgi:hypothetical protein